VGRLLLRSYPSAAVKIELAAGGDQGDALDKSGQVHDPVLGSGRHVGRSGYMTRLAEPRHQVIPNAKRIGHSGERRVHCSDAREETGVDDVKVVEFVCLAIGVED
jgi:hypothetical protein